MSEIRTTEQINEIAAALAKAQSELENVEKSGKNPAFKSRYATLSAVLDEVRPKFSKYGISILQAPINHEDSVGIVTRLAHGSSGQWIESVLFVRPQKFDAQGVGSALTYLRRYTLMAMAGIAPEDDDGEAAIERPDHRATPPKEMHRSAAAQPSANVNGGAHKAPEKSAEHPRRAEAIDAYRRLNHALDLAKGTKEAADLFRVHKDNLTLIGEVSPETYAGLKKRFAALGIDVVAEAARPDETPPDYLGADDAGDVLSEARMGVQ